MIRAAGHPVRPGQPGPATPDPPNDTATPGRPVSPGHPAEDAPADVYIYRDTGDAPDSAATAAPAQEPNERDASYWYDLSGTGTGTGTGQVSTGTGSTPALAETRGPFEPLVSSTGPGPETPALVPEPAPAPDSSAPMPPNAAQNAAPQDPALPGRTSKLEQIRELYLTAEAIGEQNVGKHFDHLLAQQRELISEYFKQSPGAQAGADRDDVLTPDHRGEPGGPDARGGQSEDAHGASVIAEQPRAW